jgi:hypothetical protein
LLEDSKFQDEISDLVDKMGWEKKHAEAWVMLGLRRDCIAFALKDQLALKDTKHKNQRTNYAASTYAICEALMAAMEIQVRDGPIGDAESPKNPSRLTRFRPWRWRSPPARLTQRALGNEESDPAEGNLAHSGDTQGDGKEWASPQLWQNPLSTTRRASLLAEDPGTDAPRENSRQESLQSLLRREAMPSSATESLPPLLFRHLGATGNDKADWNSLAQSDDK